MNKKRQINWINLLHIYQPYQQTKDILEKIVHESYYKIVNGLLKNREAKLVLNINGSLTELLAKNGYQDLLDKIRELGERGQIEFTGSAKFHSLLPRLTKTEIIRQIEINRKTNQKYLGPCYQPEGFFSPELAYSFRTARIVKSLGYRWMVIDSIAFDGQEHDLPTDTLFKIKGLGDFYALFRHRRLSNAILSGVIRDEKDFFQAIGSEQSKKEGFIMTVMDGETFGHHRPGLEKFLFQIYQSPKLKSRLAKEIFPLISNEKTVKPLASNWSSTEDELRKKLPYARWYNPKNKIQKIQWSFLKRILNKFSQRSRNSQEYPKIRKGIDRAVSTDQFWWASAEPWWSIEMIERGAYIMLGVWRKLARTKEEKEWGEKRYHQIIQLAFEWQRTGMVRFKQNKEDLPFKRETRKIPLKRRVKKKWLKGLFKQLRKAEKKAARERKYEKAILWRNASYKIKKEEDIYDLISTVDLLREKENIPDLDRVIKKDQEK